VKDEVGGMKSKLMPLIGNLTSYLSSSLAINLNRLPTSQFAISSRCYSFLESRPGRHFPGLLLPAMVVPRDW